MKTSPSFMSPPSKRVLIVDDSPLVRKAVGNLLTFDGFSVCGEAGDGAQAIEEAKQTRPDVIVLDLSMPVMDGIRAAKALKQIMPHVPLILFTAHANSALEQNALAAGISAIISKQQDAFELVSKAHELLGTKCEAETRISDRLYPVRTRLSREVNEGPPALGSFRRAGKRCGKKPARQN